MTTQHTLRRAVFPGSFDLFTLGHLDILKRGLALFDEVVVALAINPDKKYFFDVETRVRLVKEIIEEELTPEERARVSVEFSERKFIVNFARDMGARYLLRGLRGVADFQQEYENHMVNLCVNAGIEPIYLICQPKFLAVSSSSVKKNVGLEEWEDLARQFVPPASMRGLQARAAQLAQERAGNPARANDV